MQSHPTYFIVMPDGNRFGPVDSSTLQSWYFEGRILPQCQIVDAVTGQQWPGSAMANFFSAAPYPGTGPTNPYSSPQMMPGYPGASQKPGFSLIPQNNSASIVGYYAGVFSLGACIPFLGVIGIVLAIVAIWQGLQGWKQSKLPNASGGTHSIVAVLLGSASLLCGLAINGIVLLGLLAGGR